MFNSPIKDSYFDCLELKNVLTFAVAIRGIKLLIKLAVLLMKPLLDVTQPRKGCKFSIPNVKLTCGIDKCMRILCGVAYNCLGQLTLKFLD